MKRQLMLLLALAGLWTMAGTPAAYAQSEEKIYTEVDKSPEFPGGVRAMYEYLARNIQYPTMAARNKVQGKVMTTFVVGEDGTIRDITVKSGVNKEVDQEAVRVIKRMPKWVPGELQGQRVAVQYNLPINFQVE
ncbi:energy transducer TonB [Telluribacter sp. SYSU D00476]|uniref:energy transducer TonB n=1 Tax=Telluribacter sp. SYSU D00476 TaxID=2811430 RepID=UPI001FF2DD0F|nr:energy transducer TonB [Telluribacter sp. SYSU D00476]